MKYTLTYRRGNISRGGDCVRQCGRGFPMVRMTYDSLTKFRMYGSIGITCRNAGASDQMMCVRGRVKFVCAEIPCMFTGHTFHRNAHRVKKDLGKTMARLYGNTEKLRTRELATQ